MANIDFKDADLVERDPANQELVNRIAHKTIQLALFGTEANAHWKGDRMLKVEAYPIAVGSFTANRRAFRLEAGDAFILDYEPYSIERKVWRVLRIVEQSPTSETITVQCAEDIHYLSTEVLNSTFRGEGESRVNIIDPLQNIDVIEAPFVFNNADTLEILTIAGREVLSETGYLVHSSLDDTTYLQLGTVPSYAVHGTLVAEYSEDTYQIDDYVGFEIDFDNADVDQIQTIGRAGLIAGQNMALLGDEIITFQTIIPVSGVRYKIENIYRRRFDTEQLTHPIGTEIFFTRQSLVGRFQNAQFLVGTTRYFKYQPFSLYLMSELALAIPISIGIEGRAKKPYRPVNFFANGGGFRPEYTGDILLTWDGRIRGEGAGIGDADTVVDASPTYEGKFEVEVWVNDMLVRTETDIDALFWLYAIATIVADNGALPLKILFKLLNYRIDATIRYDSAQSEVTCYNTAGDDWFSADSAVVNTGSVSSGTIEDTFEEDDVYLVLNETNGSPGWDYDFIFANIPVSIDEVTIRMHGRYQGNAGHNKKVRIWNFTLVQWDNITGLSDDLPHNTVDQDYEWPVVFGSDYKSGGEFRLKMIHTSSGNVNHDLYIDHLHLDAGFVTSTTTTTTSSTTTTTT